MINEVLRSPATFRLLGGCAGTAGAAFIVKYFQPSLLTTLVIASVALLAFGVANLRRAQRELAVGSARAAFRARVGTVKRELPGRLAPFAQYDGVDDVELRVHEDAPTWYLGSDGKLRESIDTRLFSVRIGSVEQGRAFEVLCAIRLPRELFPEVGAPRVPPRGVRAPEFTVTLADFGRAPSRTIKCDSIEHAVATAVHFVRSMRRRSLVPRD